MMIRQAFSFYSWTLNPFIMKYFTMIKPLSTFLLSMSTSCFQRVAFCRFWLSSLLVICSPFMASNVFASTHGQSPSTFQIVLEPTALTFPQPGDVLHQREANVSPEDYPLARELKPLLNENRYSDALNLLDRQATSKPTLPPAFLLIKAQIHAQQAQFELATTSYQLALDAMPDLLRAHQGLALIHLKQQQFAKAHQSLTKAVRLGARDASTFAQLGYVSAQQGNNWAAVTAYQQAVMQQPENAQYQRGLLSGLIQTKQTGAAQDLLEHLLRISPQDTRLWLQRASLAMQMKEKQLALSSLETAIRLGDKAAGNRLIAAQLSLSFSHYDRAVELLKPQLNQLEFEQVAPLIRWLHREQQWTASLPLLQAYKDVITQFNKPQQSQLYSLLSELAGGRGQPDKQQGYLEQAIKMDSTNGQALIALANTLRGKKHYARAESLYVRAASLESTRYQALLSKAQLHLDKQDYDSALNAMSQALKLSPHNMQLRRNIQVVRRML